MSGRRRRFAACAVALALVAVTAVRAPAQSAAPVVSRNPIGLAGCTVVPPEGPGWISARSSSGILFGRKHPDAAHTSLAWIDYVAADSADLTVERLLAMAAPATPEGGAVPRQRLTTWEVRPDTTVAPLAVRYRYEFEDRGTGKAKGKALRCRGQGLLIVHPDYPRHLIRSDYSERAPREATFEGSAPADRFLADFAITRRTVELDPVVELEGRFAWLARHDGSLWLGRVLGSGKETRWELDRLDAGTLAITGRVPLDFWPSDLAAADDGVWTTAPSEGWVVQVDPVKLAVTRKIKCGDRAVELALAGDFLWVTNDRKGEVWKVDRASGAATRVKLPGTAWTYGILAHDGLVWVTAGGNQVFSLDAVTGEARGAPIGVAGGPRQLAWADGSMWVLCRSGQCVQRLDPATRRVVATIPLGFDDPRWLAFHNGVLWVSRGQDGSLVGLDPATNALRDTPLHVGLSVSMVPAEDGLWMSDETGHRVGRLRLP